MNLRNWSKQHTLGLLIGIASPLIMIPLVILLLSLSQHYPFSAFWDKFEGMRSVRGKFISLAIIPNLLWFYWSLNKEKYNLAMGIIVGSACFLPYILYLTFA
jgi:hypothetical protein